jgi:hypothetical protein
VFVTPELRVSDPERERALLESTADVFTALGQGFRRLPDGNVVLPVEASGFVDGPRLDPIRRGLPDPTEHRRFCDGLLREVASEVIQRELAYDECRSEFPLKGG